MATRNAAGEVVVDVEHDRVAISDKGIKRQYLRWNGASRHRKLQPFQHLNRSTRPHAPMAKKAALKAQRHFAVPGADHHWSHQIGNDVVVVAGIKRNATR